MILLALALTTAKPCAEVTHRNADLTSVSVRLAGDGPCGVSLTSFATQGPSWRTSGVQTLVGHAHVVLSKAHPTADLTVPTPCGFSQEDLTIDGGTVVVPRYPDVHMSGVIDSWNGGKPCATSTPSPSPSESSQTPSPSPSKSTSPPRVPSPTVTPSPSPTVSVLPTSTATTAPKPSPTPRVTHTAPPTPTPTLPNTGAPIGWIALFGASLIVGGLWVRRRAT